MLEFVIFAAGFALGAAVVGLVGRRIVLRHGDIEVSAPTLKSAMKLMHLAHLHKNARI